jgi:hypothetical protein
MPDSLNDYSRGVANKTTLRMAIGQWLSIVAMIRRARIASRRPASVGASWCAALKSLDAVMGPALQLKGKVAVSLSVGAIVSITYKSALDDPGRIK